MNKYFFIFAITVSVNLFSQNKNSLLIKNVNLINVEKGIITKNINIYVRDGMITQIEKDVKKIKLNATETIVNASGKYLMSGYFDSHVHLPTLSSPFSYKTYFLANLINGVTSLRVMRFNSNNIQYKDSITKELILGPSLYLSQTITEFTYYADMSKSFDDYKNNGYSFVKFLWGLSKTQLDSIGLILMKKNIPVVGHLKDGDIAQALRLKYRSIEHAKPIIDLYKKDSIELFSVISQFANNKTYYTPGMHWYYYAWDQIDKKTLYTLPELNYVPNFLKNYWIKEYNNYDSSFIVAKKEQYHKEKEEFKTDLLNFDRILRVMEKKKVKFLVGSDEQNFSVPGFTFHREIEHFVNAKIAPINIIKAITLNPAECLNVNKNVGSVKVGMVADLVILNANPLESASNLKNLNAVIKFGNYYSVKQLQELLDNSIVNDNK